METIKFKSNKIILSLIFILTIAFSFSINNTTYAVTATGSNTDPYTVAQAIEDQNNSLKTVKGYIVGQPTSSTVVLKSGYTGDTAIAIADSSTETNTSKILYVQISSTYRSTFGLNTNPSLLGTQVKVTGSLVSYFSHYGLKNTTNIEKVTSSGGSTGGDTGSGNTGGSTTGGNTSGGSTSGGSSTGTTTSYDTTYYAGAIGKTGTALKSALHGIIDNNTKLSYSAVWTALKDTDQDPNNSNNVILLYTGRSQAKSACGSGVNDWNREHVWAKSHGDFGTAAGPGTDLHHLKPADASVNSTRGNLDFDNGGTPDSEAPLCKYDSDSWEPRDSVKGDIARALFYMAVRYEGDNGEIDLELNDKVNNGTAPYFGKLSTLLQWNDLDPVDDFEKNRNNVIYNKYQHNRNPFIDHPEWAKQIWGKN